MGPRGPHLLPPALAAWFSAQQSWEGPSGSVAQGLSHWGYYRLEWGLSAKGPFWRFVGASLSSGITLENLGVWPLKERSAFRFLPALPWLGYGITSSGLPCTGVAPPLGTSYGSSIPS